MKMRMRKKRTTTGSSLRFFLAAGFALLLAAVLLPALSAKDKKKQVPAVYAVISGSVFREDGFSLPGAEVTVLPGSPEGGKKQKTTSDSRGEFAVRVPAVPVTYTVSVSKPGFAAQEKTVKVEGEGNFDANFRLAAKEGVK